MPIHHVVAVKVSKWLLLQAQTATFGYIKGRLSEQMGLSKPALSGPDAKLLLDDYLRRFEERLAQRIIDRLDEDRLMKLNSAISQLKMAARVPIDHRQGYLERALGNFFDIASLPEGTTAGFPNAQLRSLACLGIAAIHLGADEIVAENLAEALCTDLDTARTWFGEETIQTVLAAYPELRLPQQQMASPQQNQKKGLTPSHVLTPQISPTIPASPVRTKAEWLKLGDEHCNAGHYNEALNACEQALRIDPNDADIYASKGYVLYVLKRYQEALGAYEQAIRLNPNDALAIVGKGAALNGLKRYQEALGAYEQAICLDPNEALAIAGKGDALNGLKRYNEALQAYEQAIRLDPYYGEAYNGKGSALQQLGRRQEAEQAYAAARRLGYDS